MTQEQAEDLQAIADELGLQAEVREGYSGRGMYGRETHALVLNDGDVFDLGVLVGVYMERNANLSLRRGLRTDSMGLGVVLY